MQKRSLMQSSAETRLPFASAGKLFLLSAIGSLILSASVNAAEKVGARQWEQRPELAASQTRGSEAVDTPAAPVINYQAGPTPEWIWGGDADTNYALTKTFTTDATRAWVKASSDNHLRLLINGQRVAASDTWQEPVEVEISKYLQAGENRLTAEVANDGGAAAFVLKLVLKNSEGETSYIVSDGSWKAAPSQAAPAEQGVAVRTLGKLGVGPWGDVLAAPSSVARDVFNVLPGFQVERLFTVPKEELGSWVAIGVDPRGRIIASDQGALGLCRITPPPIGSDQPTKVERLDLEISAAQGILCAFDSLYLSVNGGPGSGLYRARDTDQDDQYDELVKLADFQGGGEHGPHALRLSPDGESIYVICGNHTNPPAKIDASRIPTNWSEDLLLPRQWDANGHAAGRLAPGGWIAKTDPDGKTWEMISVGYRNPYSMDFNADGELFAYDADMEWDMGSPWYRPTRVVHATSGSEFGWRSGTGKWPTYYADSLPELIDIGPGSPVGVSFGYGTKFPPRYQRALYICDWTFGTMYALHLTPDGASYTATKEEFVSRTPLPLTDVTVAADGALYFTVGGRGTQSELFRVTYVGEESTAAVDPRDSEFADLRALRHELESLHHPSDNPQAVVAKVWPHLGHPDRYLRYAARMALEHQPADVWAERVFAEQDPLRRIHAAVALARQGDAALQGKLLAALGEIDLDSLPESDQLALLRAYQLVFTRMGEPQEEARLSLISKLDPHFPAPSDALNRELSSLLVYLRAPSIVAKTLPLMAQEPNRTAEDLSDLLARNRGYGTGIAKMLANQPDKQQIHYAFVLRNLKEGWTLEQRIAYFKWFEKARQWSGGASYQGFLQNIDHEAFENASEAERLAVEALGARKPFRMAELPKPQGPGKEWTVAEVVELAESGLKGRDFKRGEQMFAAARCVLCHRFAGDGGATGPDLTQLAGRFTLRDLTEATVEPSKVISDQYRASTVLTVDGSVHTGRIVSETPEMLRIVTDPEDSTKMVEIMRSDIDVLRPAPVSLMPTGLLDSLNQEEVLDLLAYLLSRGNPNDAMFRQ